MNLQPIFIEIILHKRFSYSFLIYIFDFRSILNCVPDGTLNLSGRHVFEYFACFQIVVKMDFLAFFNNFAKIVYNLFLRLRFCFTFVIFCCARAFDIYILFIVYPYPVMIRMNFTYINSIFTYTR